MARRRRKKDEGRRDGTTVEDGVDRDVSRWMLSDKKGGESSSRDDEERGRGREGGYMERNVSSRWLEAKGGKGRARRRRVRGELDPNLALKGIYVSKKVFTSE